MVTRMFRRMREDVAEVPSRAADRAMRGPSAAVISHAYDLSMAFSDVHPGIEKRSGDLNSVSTLGSIDVSGTGFLIEDKGSE